MSEDNHALSTALESGNATVHATVEGSVRLVRVSGEIDRFDVPSLGRVFRRACGDDGEVIVRLDGITFIDTAGARALFEALADRRAKGVTVVVASRNAKLDRVLAVLGLTL